MVGDPRHRCPAHHFPEDMLLDYADGSLPEPQSIMVATHLAFCADCRAAVADFEAVGGALLGEIAPSALAPDALERVLACLDTAEAPAEARPTPGMLPSPLCDYLAGDPGFLPWQLLAAGIDEVELRPGLGAAGMPWPAGVQVSLVRFAPGASAPRHTHLGIEATVIVQGGFADQFGTYEQGDAWIVDATVDHRPVALPDEPCLCLVYLDAPRRATGD